MSDLATLYPFLYGGGDGLETLLAEMRRSGNEKLKEIRALRAACVDALSDDLHRAARALCSRLRHGATVFTMGNGGSATDASALAGLFASPPLGRAWPALCLTDDVAGLTAISNDVGYDAALARMLGALARPGDGVVALSTSGNSPNLVRGLAQAKRLGLLTVGLAGDEGGRFRDLALDHLLIVPSPSVHRIQEVQTTLYQLLWESVQSLAE
jgi:D-sedoheptulose 7-phosphate isomerase